MKKYRTLKFCLLSLLTFTFLLINNLVSAKGDLPYAYNPHVHSDVWVELEPYFLPSNHPIKSKLDAIFSDKRVTLSLETLKEAKFEFKVQDEPSKIILAKHPKLKGYLLKVYLDTQPANEWMHWKRRIEGSLLIRKYIKQKKIKGFKVPHKWIYPLPEDPSPEGNFISRKNFILVVEDMNILPFKHNVTAYRERISKERLTTLFFILKDVGLLDSVYIDNIPFNYSGDICFIDTEHYHRWPINFGILKGWLSPSMQKHWQNLIDHN